MEGLRAFLESRRVAKDGIHTHTTKGTGSLENGWFSGSYYISKEDTQHFMILYCNAVKKKSLLTVTEIPKAFFPLRMDFDFKAKPEIGLKRQYNAEMLKNIVKICQEELKNIIHPDAFDIKMLWCIVLEKKAPRNEDGYVKDGFHLHFPFFICNEWIQDIHMRDHVTKKMIDMKIWDKCKFTTSIEEIIDKRMGKKPWMMYGSTNYKNIHSSPYIFNAWDNVEPKNRYGHVFDHNQDEIRIEDMFNLQLKHRKNSAKYYLPEFLSIRNYSCPTQLVDEMGRKEFFSSQKIYTKRKNIQRKRTDDEILEDIKLIKDGMIMEMISNDRADSYGDWMDVGWTLYNIGEGGDEALEMWIEFSKRSAKFKDGECEKLWNQMQLSDKSIASLLYMAKLDHPEEYNKWKESNVRKMIFDSIKTTKVNEHDVALVVYKMYGDLFLCAESKKDIWYYYYNHRWRLMDGGIELRRKILEGVVGRYSEFSYELCNSIADIEYKINTLDNDSEEARRMIQERKAKENEKKNCNKVIQKLKEMPFLNAVISMSKIYMYKPDFLVKMNENRNFIGCENGVIDLDLGVFRDGKPDDYITFSTGQTYTEYHEKDDEVIEMEEYFRKVYPNPNIREYFFDFIAGSLKGNIHKRFGVFTGPSDGAKSMTFNLLEYCFGSGEYGYFGKFPRELLVQSTTKNSSSSSRPELARVRGKIFMATQEVTKLEKINIGFVKEATGNDSIYVRSHYEKGTEIRPNFTLLMACNEPPEIPGHDEAMWGRVRVIDHEAKFVKPQDLKKYPVPESEEEQYKKKRFKADPSLGEKIKYLANVFLWKIFRRYMKIKNLDRIDEPEEVTISTSRYHDNNDVYRKFFSDKIEKVHDIETAKKTVIKLTEVYSMFKDWYKDEHPSYRCDVGKSTLKHELIKKMGERKSPEDVYGWDEKKSGWMGFTISKGEEEEEDIFI